MKLYFNNSQTPINISQFNHIISMEDGLHEVYDVTLDNESDISEIARTYENTTITSIIIKTDDEETTRFNKNSLHLGLSSVSGHIDEFGSFVSMQLINI